MKGEFEIIRQEPNDGDYEPSDAPCPYCGGPMLVGEANSDGICTNCYFKAIDEANAC